MEIIVILPCLLHEQGPHSLRIIIKKVLKLYTMSTKDADGKRLYMHWNQTSEALQS